MSNTWILWTFDWHRMGSWVEVAKLGFFKSIFQCEPLDNFHFPICKIGVPPCPHPFVCVKTMQGCVENQMRNAKLWTIKQHEWNKKLRRKWGESIITICSISAPGHSTHQSKRKGFPLGVSVTEHLRYPSLSLFLLLTLPTVLSFHKEKDSRAQMTKPGSIYSCRLAYGLQNVALNAFIYPGCRPLLA